MGFFLEGGTLWFLLQQMALLGGPVTGGEPASSVSGSVNPVTSVLPFSLSKGKGKGKNCFIPPWYEHHFGQPVEPADEEIAPEDNVLTLPEQSFELPNDVVRSHRYAIGKGKVVLSSRENLPTLWRFEMIKEKGGSRCAHLVPILPQKMTMLLMDGMSGAACRKPYMLLKMMAQA